MKRRAGVSTDSELAGVVGLGQSAVANWRRRGKIPEAALIRFETELERLGHDDGLRLIYAKAVALRLPEWWYQKLKRQSDAKPSREVCYFTVATALPLITKEIARQMAAIEQSRGLETATVSMQLLEDDRFLSGLLDWLNSISAGEVFAALMDQ